MHPTTPPLNPIHANEKALPFSTVSMDFITDLPQSKGFDALFVVVDHNLTKGIVLMPCNKTIDALGTSKLYHENIYRRFRLPTKLISNRGPQFASKVFQELCRKTGMKSAMSTAHHPQTDGQTERTNQEIKAYLRIYCGSHPETWTDHISDLEFSHNQRTHSATHQSPFALMMGYEPTAIPPITTKTLIPSLTDRLQLLTRTRSEALAAHELVRRTMVERITRHFKPFKLHDKVWLESTNLNHKNPHHKLNPKREGPFAITEVLSPWTYRLKLPNRWKIHPVFHASLLTPFQQNDTHGPSFSEPPPILINNKEEFEVEAITAH